VKLLVTGGAGYIGAVVAAQLVDSGHEVVVLDDLSTGHGDNAPGGAALVRGRIRDAARVLDGAGFDGVLHFAAKSLVAESVANPERYWDNNVCGTLALLTAMRGAGVRRLVFSSTAATYGEPSVSPITEDVPAVPINPYGQSKLAVDHMLTGEAAAHGLAAASLRYFNVGGAYGRHGERHDPTCWRSLPAAGSRPTSSAPTTRRPTARRFATTCTSSTCRPRTCSRSRPSRRAGTTSSTSAREPATRSARCSTPAVR
jgi:UDP-glucose 4-epimerase